MHSSASDIRPEEIISQHTEKAFDRFEWNYLFALHKFGFGSEFTSWTRLLYHQPKAVSVTNKLLTESLNP